MSRTVQVQREQGGRVWSPPQDCVTAHGSPQQAHRQRISQKVPFSLKWKRSLFPEICVAWPRKRGQALFQATQTVPEFLVMVDRRSDIVINQEARCLELMGRFVRRSVRCSSRNTVVLNLRNLRPIKITGSTVSES